MTPDDNATPPVGDATPPDGDATPLDGDATPPAGDPRPVRAPMGGPDAEPPTAPLTEAARRAGGGSAAWRPPGAGERSAGARGPATAGDPAGAEDASTARQRPTTPHEAGGRSATAPRRPPTEATSSFDRFVLWTIAFAGRLVRAWRLLSAKHRLAAYAAFGLFVGLFLPWYSQTVVATGPKAAVQPTSVSLSGWDAFSLVQTVVLLVSIGVLVLLLGREEEGRALRVPGGDGGAILTAGGVACVLIVWGIFDRPGSNGPGQYTTATGIEWGIFIVLGLAALLTYAGSQIRAAYLAEARTRAATPVPTGAPQPQRQRHRPRPSPAPATDWDDDATRVSTRPPYDQPTPVSTRRSALDAPTKVSARRAAPAEEPAQRIGPPVAPADPPTMRVTRRRRLPTSAPDPQDGRSTNEK
jgi:hypothetical protein